MNSEKYKRKSVHFRERIFVCHSCPKKNWVKTEDFLYFFFFEMIRTIIPKRI